MQQNRFFGLKFLGSGYLAGLLVFSTLLLASCGGGSSEGGADTSNDSATLQQGVFVDSAVAGLSYRTASREGVTDSNGTFRYRAGEQVRFLIGDLELGRSDGQALVSPLNLVAGADDANDPAVTNICRLLQSLDADGNPNNGIVLPDAVHAAMTGRQIAFAITPEAFSNDTEILGLLAALNAQNTFPNGPRTLISAAQARSHLMASLGLDENSGEQDCSNGGTNCPTAESSFEISLRGLINSYRNQSGLGPLTFDSALYQLAQQHSNDMQAVGEMSHDGFQERYVDSGYRACVENVAWNYQTPESLLSGWQNSSGHDRNLLNVSIDFVGLSKSGPYSTFFACGN